MQVIATSVQELVDKAPLLPKDIQWHFIGALQSNKCKSLVGVENLWVVETVDSTKLADKLDKAVAAVRSGPLNVMVQVNTSAEETKSGVGPSEAAALVGFIQDKCPHLRVMGLMTIGHIDYSPSPECFQVLVDCRRRVAEQVGLLERDLELSMGMSGDYEAAIRLGSTNVRIGSTIFGARSYPAKKH